MVRFSKKHEKGYLYTIEVMIMIALVVMASAYLFRFPVFVSDSNTDILEEHGQNVLLHLADNGLRNLTYNDMDTLNAEIDNLLPVAVNSVACIDCTDVDIPFGVNVVVLRYHMTGVFSYSPKTLELYLWGRSVNDFYEKK